MRRAGRIGADTVIHAIHTRGSRKYDPGHHYVFFTDNRSAEFPFSPDVEIIEVATSVPTIEAVGTGSRRSLEVLGRWLELCGGHQWI